MTFDAAKLPGGSLFPPAVGGGEAAGPATGNVVVPLVMNAQYSAQYGPWASYIAGDIAGSPGGGNTCATVGVGGTFRMFFTVPVAGWTATEGVEGGR